MRNHFHIITCSNNDFLSFQTEFDVKMITIRLTKHLFFHFLINLTTFLYMKFQVPEMYSRLESHWYVALKLQYNYVMFI
jgi:hypothetical protein